MCVTIFSTGGKFCPVPIFTQLHTLTLVTRSYALLVQHIVERCFPVGIPSTLKVEDNRCVYVHKDAFLRLSTSFSILRGAVICVIDSKQNELDTEKGSYTVVLSVSPLVSLTIAKFISLNKHRFVVALF